MLRAPVVMVVLAAVVGLGGAWLDDPGAAVAGRDPAGAWAGGAAGGTWGSAEPVPGLAALNKGGSAEVASVSCGSAGNCSAVGFYTDGSGHWQGLIDGQAGGTWRSATPMPGLRALNQGGLTEIRSVSCASAGNCSAGGFYTDAAGREQVFVVNEVNGVWGTAEEVPGSAALNTGGKADIEAVSCGAPGNCSAGGPYTDAAGGEQAFVVNERNGSWRKAKEVPGTAALNTGGAAGVSVSCGSASNCSGGGSFADSSHHVHSFVVSEVNGVWGTAQQVPGMPALDKGGGDGVVSLSCAKAGYCTAGGSYTDAAGGEQAFVVNERNGSWGKAKEVPGIAALDKSGDSWIYKAVSCAAPGNCSAGGIYSPPSGGTPAFKSFVVNEMNGVWGTAQAVPVSKALNPQDDAEIFSLSCGAIGNCSAGGELSNGELPFVVSEANGIWGKAEAVPGIAALSTGGAEVNSVSCASPNHCSAGGGYTDKSGRGQGFVVTES